MLFHEIYGCYYNAVAKIISVAVEGTLTNEKAQKIVEEYAFEESFLTVLPALKNQRWQLLDENLKTPLHHAPTQPLTTLQKRWLKAISLDPRVRLFGIDFQLPEDIQPLFTSDDYVVYDQFADGDPYTDEAYIQRFKTALQAIKQGKKLKVCFSSGKGNAVTVYGYPYKLEYSEKDNKFRLLLAGCRHGQTVNMGRIRSCEFAADERPERVQRAIAAAIKAKENKKFFVMELTDERNVLERVMLQFTQFDKEAEKISDKRYRVKVYYEEADETELVIAVLSFGQFVKVIEPTEFVNLIIERLKKQKNCGLR